MKPEYIIRRETHARLICKQGAEETDLGLYPSMEHAEAVARELPPAPEEKRLVKK